jgi:membrane protease YdiL (CAAX protease family)
MGDAKDSADLGSPRTSAPPSPERFVRIALGFYAALFAAACAWRFGVDGIAPWRASAAVVPWPLSARIAAGLALGAALIAASRLWTARSTAGRRLADELAAVVAGLTARQALLLAAASGLAEEAFFRGALQPRVGWLPASLLFGLAHFHPRRDLRAWSASAVVAGLAFGQLFEHSGDLLAPALAHAVVNAVNLHWLANPRPTPPPAPTF